MKKYLLLSVLYLSASSLFADSIHIQNNTKLNAVFTMSSGGIEQYKKLSQFTLDPKGVGDGPFCVPPGDVIFAHAERYTQLSVYILYPDGTKEECFIDPNVVEKLKRGGQRDLVVVIERCSNPSLCAGSNFKVKNGRVNKRLKKFAQHFCPKDAAASAKQWESLPTTKIALPATKKAYWALFENKNTQPIKVTLDYSPSGKRSLTLPPHTATRIALSRFYKIKNLYLHSWYPTKFTNIPRIGQHYDLIFDVKNDQGIMYPRTKPTAIQKAIAFFN